MHARAFVVAGAMRDDLLSDLRAAVEKGIAGGTIADFRKDFDRIVQERGWNYKGGRSWRTRVIYDTNLRSTYQAGRFKQMKEAAVTRPWWRYRHNDASTRPRVQHLSWNGLILRHDDPWWSTHFPPNGWGCKCFTETLSDRDLKRLGRNGPDQAPPVQWREVTVGEKGPNPRTVRVPEGIDPGWGYNPGEAAWGRETALNIMRRGPFEEIDSWKPEKYPWLPDKLIPKDLPVSLGPRIHDDVPALRAALPEGIYTDRLGERVNVTQAIVDHILEKPETRWNGREQYFPLIPDILSNPSEIWLGFVRHQDGKYAIRRRYVTAYHVDENKNRMAGVLADTQDGNLVAFDVIHGSNLTGGRFRLGRLAHSWSGQ
jgi:hypothetical protein